MIAFRLLTGLSGATLAALIATGSPVTAASEPRGSTLDVALGKALFARLWVAAPSSTAAADGLGPLFNARSCSGCHQGAGPAQFVDRNGALEARGLVVRVAAPDGSPHPDFGVQIQDRALPGMTAEARVKPTLQGGVLHVATVFMWKHALPPVLETRVAPSLKGRAALGHIDEKAVLALADPHDRNGDGISGRPQMVRDERGHLVLGRYGFKATGASLVHQTADAAALDLGLSSPLVPRPFGDCTVMQVACTERPSGRSAISDGEEISADVVRLLATYLETLDPAPVDFQSKGLRLFTNTGCAGCHTPALPGRDGTQYPLYTDLLLHDLGPEGASRIKAGEAYPSEWRTTPLIGLDPLNGKRRYLHDGRAADLREAIGQHGGEARAARDAFLAADGREQQMILDFLTKQ